MQPTRGALAWKLRAIERAQPISVHLELTYRCNWRCVFCYNPRHNDVRGLSGAEWIAVLDELRLLGTLTVTLTGGEPLTHPDFFAVAGAARERGFALKLFTNGSLIDAGAAERIAALRPLMVELSLHGATPEVHDRTTARPGSFAAMWRGIAHLRRAGTAVLLKTPLTRLNEGELDAIVDLVERQGLALRIDPTLTPRDDGDRTPLGYAASSDGLKHLMAVLRNVGQLPANHRSEDGVNCSLGRGTLAVDPEGNVYPCIQWRTSSLGNVREARLSELWAGSAARQQAAGVAREANRVLRALGEPAASFPFCPALAAQLTGDPLRPDPVFFERARAAQAARGAVA